MRLLARSWWFACFLLLQVAGIGQLYPFVHVHHVHDDEGTRLVLSIHPPTVGDSHIEATDDNEHHHDTDHVALDCNLCQRLLSQLQRQADIVVYASITNENVSLESLVHHTSDPPPFHKSPSVIPPDLRGPPVIV
jgi:hypothetical protein